MQKLIKLSDTHYIVVDDSEIKEDDLVLNPLNEIQTYFKDYNFVESKKITHSTQPLEEIGEIYQDGKLIGKDYAFYEIERLSLSEVEEAINGYSVEEFAWNNPILSRKDVYDLFHKVFKDRRLDGAFSLSASKQIYQFETELREISKIKAHQELVKDKLFTKEDMINSLKELSYQLFLKKGFSLSDSIEKSSKIIQSLLPKTEWDIEFVDGKIKLL